MLKALMIISLFMLLSTGCINSFEKTAPVVATTVKPGSHVSQNGQVIQLSDGDMSLNTTLPKVTLIDSNMEEYVFSADGHVKVVSIVPSVDTRVCEAQTHILGDTEMLDERVLRLTVSRDLPMALRRFAEEAKLTNIKYLSDYKQGEFGRQTGLLMNGSSLLARAVLVVDGVGRVRYFQITPEVAHLPDMDRAFQEANKLVGAR